MLVLSRKPSESLTITSPGQPTIEVKIIYIAGNRVGLGVEAPRSVKVRRTELVETLDYEKRGAQ